MKIQFTRFGKEITWVVMLKLGALFLLWKLCFAHPMVDQLQTSVLVHHYLTDKSNLY